jgi:hypothetical protein
VRGLVNPTIDAQKWFNYKTSYRCQAYDGEKTFFSFRIFLTQQLNVFCELYVSVLISIDINLKEEERGSFVAIKKQTKIGESSREKTTLDRFLYQHVSLLSDV